MYGSRYPAQKSLELQMINDMYKDREDMLNKIKKFSSEYAPKGVYRESAKDMKISIYKDVYNKLMMNPMSLHAIKRVARMK